MSAATFINVAGFRHFRYWVCPRCFYEVPELRLDGRSTPTGLELAERSVEIHEQGHGIR